VGQNDFNQCFLDWIALVQHLAGRFVLRKVDHRPSPAHTAGEVLRCGGVVDDLLHAVQQTVVALFAVITVLLSMTVFQLIVAEKVPESSHSVPLIGTYVRACRSETF